MEEASGILYEITTPSFSGVGNRNIFSLWRSRAYRIDLGLAFIQASFRGIKPTFSKKVG